MPKVSVIVPIYNVEQYLRECMDSILAQTLTDLEVICVDDGSTDRSPGILDDYASRDPRVHVIHRENHGYGQSVNVGMDRAVGEYIGIVESDDRILPDMYEKLYNAAREYDLDFVKSDCIFWWDTLKYFYTHHRNYLDEYYDRVLDGSSRRIFYNFFMNIWTGIYKKEFLTHNQIRCNETPGASYQDNGFWMQTMSMAERAMWLGEAFYLYRQDNPASSIKSKGKAMAMKEEYNFAEEILERKQLWKEVDICHYFLMLRHKGTFMRISDELKREYCGEIIRDFEKYRELTIQNEAAHSWLKQLYEEPELFCNEFIERKAKALRQLQEAEYIIIYGAGNCGQKALRIMTYQGVTDKVLCFAISDKKANGHIGIIPVRCIDELTEYRHNAVVVIGTNEYSEIYSQMRERLEELGFICTLNFYELIHYFYHLQ